MDPKQSLSQGDDVDDEARTSSTEDISDGSRDSPTLELAAPPPARAAPHLSLSCASSSNPSVATTDTGAPHAPLDVHASQLCKPNGAMADGAAGLDDEKKREHKRRSKNWTRAETLKLIKVRTELDERFRKSGKKSALWEEIAISLQRDKFSRDGQQCKDKWEKLTAGYKEVRDGTRDKDDHPFYNELHLLLSWKSYKKEGDGCADGGDAKRVKFEDRSGPGVSQWNQAGAAYAVNLGVTSMMRQQQAPFNHAVNSMEVKDARLNHSASRMEMKDARPNHTTLNSMKMKDARPNHAAGSGSEMKDARLNHRIDTVKREEAHRQEASIQEKQEKRKRVEPASVLETSVVQELLESIITRQQRFVKELLDAVDRKEQLKEQMRHAREEKWRAEERAQRYAFSSAMIRLTHRLLGERLSTTAAATSMEIVPAGMVATTSNGGACPKKRSKNWKKSEVSNLIRIRHDMESKFVSSTRRAGLWDELGEKLASLGIKRDGKQCREKWDKLMAEYKDVMDGRKDKDESIHFSQLTAIFGRAKEGDAKSSSDATKDECTADT